MSLLIGWAEESIVPDKKVSLAGQFFERISEYVESEITVTAMAVESDGEQMILVSADVVSLWEGHMEMSREKLAKILPEFDVNKLVAAATHTHTSHRMSVPERVNFTDLNNRSKEKCTLNINGNRTGILILDM